MKKVLLIASILSVGAAQAQKTTKPATKPVVKSASAAPALKNLSDSASYAMGIAMASFYSQQGIKNINSALVAQAIRDVTVGKKTNITEANANDIIMQLMNKAQASKVQPAVKAGQDFLAKNKTKPGVKTTASGIQYEVVKEGSGPKPAATDTVVVHYKGTLLDGTEFDNSYTRGEPATFPLNRVIQGWTEGVALMPVGSKYKLYIPHTLAYGVNDNGPIPGGSLLVFEVELLEIKGKK
jgi:FKBP-type peptidyl-prolyl cis-trans isomerase FklB